MGSPSKRLGKAWAALGGSISLRLDLHCRHRHEALYNSRRLVKRGSIFCLEAKTLGPRFRGDDGLLQRHRLMKSTALWSLPMRKQGSIPGGVPRQSLEFPQYQ